MCIMYLVDSIGTELDSKVYESSSYRGKIALLESVTVKFTCILLSCLYVYPYYCHRLNYALGDHNLIVALISTVNNLILIVARKDPSEQEKKDAVNKLFAWQKPLAVEGVSKDEKDKK